MTTTLPDRNIFMPLIATGPVTDDHPYESALLALIIDSPLQQRPRLQRNAVLMNVAQKRANDLIARNYFDHVDPDGFGANHHVRVAGFPLPGRDKGYSESPAGNNIESLAAGQATLADVWAVFQASEGHGAHVFGRTEFFAAQTELGIGYAYSGAYTYGHIWVVIVAAMEMESGE